MGAETGLLLVGTHRRAHHGDPQDIAHGIYTFRFEATGARPLGEIEVVQPGWLAVHPTRRFCYAVNEVKDFEGAGGGVSAFSLNPQTGKLQFLNSARTPSQPCHCEVDASGKFLLVATFGGGSVLLFALGADGRIGQQLDMHQHTGSSVHPRRQISPHPHAVHLDSQNQFVLVPDLGTDQIWVYELDHTGRRLLPRADLTRGLPPGSGPRHLAFHPNGEQVFLINEMSATVTRFTYSPASGSLAEQDSVDLLPPGFTGLKSGGEIAVHPTGKYLYASTRSHGSSGPPPAPGLDMLVWLRLDESGSMHLVGRVSSTGQIPRSFIIIDGGHRLLVAHQCSGTVVCFALDAKTGEPVPTGQVFQTPVPVCLQFVSGPMASV